MDTRLLGNVMGSIRTGVGASLVVAPAWAGRVWVGDDADGHGTKVFARALGARDVALGVGLLSATKVGRPRQVARLLQLGAAADVADMVATLIAWRNLSGHRRWLMPTVAVGVGVAGAAVAQAVERAARKEELSPTTGEPFMELESDAASVAGIIDQQGALLEEMEMGVARSAFAPLAPVGED